jgi:hypothetical protein
MFHTPINNRQAAAVAMFVTVAQIVKRHHSTQLFGEPSRATNPRSLRAERFRILS